MKEKEEAMIDSIIKKIITIEGTIQEALTMTPGQIITVAILTGIMEEEMSIAVI